VAPKEGRKEREPIVSVRTKMEATESGRKEMKTTHQMGLAHLAPSGVDTLHHTKCVK
jgi:hypothetical protein